MTKQAIIEALAKFINQRSGIDARNYGGSREAFMGEYRPILTYGRHARQMLRYVELRDTITADCLLKASRAYSGRLQFVEDGDKVRVEYTTGQYFPTEYRRAACAVLSQAIWDWLASDLETGDRVRKAAKRELGRGIANKWFN